MLGQLASAIGAAGGDIGAVDLVESSRDRVIRDITIKTRDSAHAGEIIDGLNRVPGVRVINVSDRTFLMHLGGKIGISNKIPVKTRSDLSMAYTPGVARVCMAIANNPDDARRLTIKRNSVAVVTDGSAVLGLGNIGPKAALPVMEGKAALFKRFAGIDAWPLCLDTQDTDEIVAIVKAIAPGFAVHILRLSEENYFFWLQSVDEPALAFVVTDPSIFFKDYQVPIREETQTERRPSR